MASSLGPKNEKVRASSAIGDREQLGWDKQADLSRSLVTCMEPVYPLVVSAPNLTKLGANEDVTTPIPVGVAFLNYQPARLEGMIASLFPSPPEVPRVLAWTRVS